MKVLVPFDASESSDRALRFAAEFVRRYEGALHVVHVTDVHDSRADEVRSEAQAIVDEEGIDDDPELLTDMRTSGTRYASDVGAAILERVDEEGYDHVVMGHHGAGAMEKLVLGSATETVVKDTEIPVTIVP